MNSSYESGFGIAGVVIYLAIIVLVIVGLWKIFEKAGKPGWTSIIPIYNLIVLLEIIGKPIWSVFLMLIPFVNIIFGIWAINLLSKSFGKSTGFTVGMVLLGFIFIPLLGFSNAVYTGPSGKTTNLVGL